MRSIALVLFSFSLVAQPGLFRPESSSFEDLGEARADDFDVIWSTKDERLAQWVAGRWRQSIRAKKRRSLAERRGFEIEPLRAVHHYPVPPAPPSTPQERFEPDPDLLRVHQMLGVATVVFGAYLTFRKR